jgi:hypothetical protein
MSLDAKQNQTDTKTVAYGRQRLAEDLGKLVAAEYLRFASGPRGEPHRNTDSLRCPKPALPKIEEGSDQ